MQKCRGLQIALLISFSVHTVAILNSRFFPFFNVAPEERKTKINYVKIKDIPKKEAGRRPLLPPQKIPPPFVDPDTLLKENSLTRPQKMQPAKPELIKPDRIAVKKKVVLPPLGMAKISNPSYLGYYQVVREKIRRSAYQNYTRNQTGEAYLAFVILGDGTLKGARVLEEKSSGNPYLNGIALSSVKEASPFPSFPKELDYPELSFNVVISFEIE